MPGEALVAPWLCNVHETKIPCPLLAELGAPKAETIKSGAANAWPAVAHK